MTFLSFQRDVEKWVAKAFGYDHVRDLASRNQHFLEEALELSQVCGCSQSEAHRLVDYVFDRPIGQKKQEVGGVLMTLSILASVHGILLDDAARTELQRCWEKIDLIRQKNACKPKLLASDGII